LSDPLSVHRILLGTSGIESQLALYHSTCRGFSGKDKSMSLIEATLIKALSLAKETGSSEVQQVVFYAPTPFHIWISTKIQKLAGEFVARVRASKDSLKRRKALSLLRTWLESVKVGTPKLKGLPQPERWVAIGYLKSDPQLPDWFKSGLL